jgi:hypothetical protein
MYVYIYIYIDICIFTYTYIYIYLFIYFIFTHIYSYAFLYLYSQNGGMDASHMSDYMEKINGPGHKMSPLQVRSILGKAFVF